MYLSNVVYDMISFLLQDIWGSPVDGGEKIGTLFFDGQKLKEWNAPTLMKLEKYERIRTVGKGNGERKEEVFIVESTYRK